MTPHYFGPPGRRLFACLHPAQGPAFAAVLLCPPFGQEAMRAHRLLRVLAERLARQGCAVLRFDPFGTGDSEGEDTDADLVGWQADLLAAHHHLRSHAAGLPMTWLGLGLGGTAVLLASQTAPLGLVKLVVCTPVSDGRAYLAALRQRHVRRLDEVLALPSMPTSQQQALADPASHLDQALGFGLGDGLRLQLLALAGLPLPGRPCVCLADVALAYSGQPVAGPGQRVEPVADRVDWLADTPDNGTLIPARLLAQLMLHMVPAT